MLTAIINQKPVQRLRKRLGWDLVFDVSDYQNIVNIVYIGLLGIEKDISEEYEESFYQSYKKELLLYESYKKIEEVILWQLERYRIEALLLMDTEAGEMYPKPEMSHISQIEFLVDKKDLPLVHRLMLEMDYEQKEELLNSGIVYVRVPGVRVVFYNKMPVENKAVRRYFAGPVRRHRRMEPYKYIHVLTNEDAYLYRVARLVELYITGKLKIRDIMDLWQFKKLLGEKLRWRAVKELLMKAEWQEFISQVELLAVLWFGEDVEEQYGLALELEEYILSRGRENKHLDEALLPCEKVRLDFYWRNRDKEWTLRRQAWLFPSREYMVQFFPVLEKYPFLLVFCWIARNTRFARRICVNKCRRIGFRIQIRLSDMKEKLKGMMGRDKIEEMPEYEPEDNAGGKSGDLSEAAVRMEDEREDDAGGKSVDLSEGAARTEEKTEESAGGEPAEDTMNLDETEGEKKVEEFEDQN